MKRKRMTVRERSEEWAWREFPMPGYGCPDEFPIGRVRVIQGASDGWLAGYRAAQRDARRKAAPGGWIMPTQPTEPRIAIHHGRECWFGLLGSADTLGHANVSTTRIYAEMSLERAKEIALKVG